MTSNIFNYACSTNGVEIINYSSEEKGCSANNIIDPSKKVKK